MPVLGELQLVDLTLPASGARITVNRNITHNDVADAAKLESSMDTQRYTLFAVIKKWDMTEADGSPAEISLDNISKLNYIDVEFVNKWVTSVFNELRKKEALSEDETLKSSNTSQQSIPVTHQE
jgi:hypothetical protein